jgi:hypothetical protein
MPLSDALPQDEIGADFLVTIRLAGADAGTTPSHPLRNALEARHPGLEVREIIDEKYSAVFGPGTQLVQNGNSWLIFKGIIFEVEGSNPRVDLADLLAQYVAGGSIDWNRYEGTFALCVWDATRRRGVAVNDQLSQLNLCYAITPDALHVSTSAMTLARALGNSLDAAGTRAFLARDAVIAPDTLFDGIKRLIVGERIEVSDEARVLQHWFFPRENEKWSFKRSVHEATRVLVDRISRYAAVADGPVLLDLTSGYDSRLLASAADRAGVEMAVTVNGPPGDGDVVVAHKVSRAAGWEMHYFDPNEFWHLPIDSDLRRKLTWATDGNLPFTNAYHQALTRPILARKFKLHTIGVGGDYLRYHPWAHELTGIGRRRRANVENLLRYRYLQEGPPPPNLFRSNWYDGFVDELRGAIVSRFNQMAGSLTNLQNDAVLAWKQTGQVGLYCSAFFNWLPTAAPSFGPGLVSTGMRIPWRYRLTARLTRHVTYQLCPRAATVVTRYGGTAAPLSFRTFHHDVSQPFKRLGYLMRKLYVVARPTPGQPAIVGVPGSDLSAWPPKPFLTPEFREFLNPSTMHTRDLYDESGLKALLGASDDEILANPKWVLRIATLEQVCRELNIRPDGDLLSTGFHEVISVD